MKKLITILFIFSFLTTQSQELTEYGWKQWGIYSLVPVGADINENTADTFEVESDSYLIRKEIWDIKNANLNALEELLSDAMEEAGITHVGQVSHFTSNGNSIDYITGRDSNNNAILVGLIRGGTKKLAIKYTIICNESDWNTAMKMLKSVKMK